MNAKRSRQLDCRGDALRWIASMIGVLFLVGMALSAQDLSTQIEILPSNPASADPVFVRASGTWRNSCVPSNPRVRISGSSISIESAYAPDTACLQALTPWSVTTELGCLPAGTYRVVMTYTLDRPSEIARKDFVVVPSSEPCKLSPAGLNPARKEMVFPFFVKASSPDQRFDSRFEVINPNATDTVVTFRFSDSSGKQITPLAASGQGATLTANRLQLGPHAVGRLQFSFPDTGGLLGWVALSSTEPLIVQEDVTRSVSPIPPGLLRPPSDEPFVPRSRISKVAPVSTRRAVVRVVYSPEPDSTDTALAVVFAGSQPPGTLPDPPDLRTFGRMTLRNDAGRIVAQTSLWLGLNRQLVSFFSGLFPSEASAGFAGLLELEFDQNVFVTAVQVTTRGPEERWEEPNGGPLLEALRLQR